MELVENILYGRELEKLTNAQLKILTDVNNEYYQVIRILAENALADIKKNSLDALIPSNIADISYICGQSKRQGVKFVCDMLLKLSEEAKKFLDMRQNKKEAEKKVK
ncbi:MAG: hypothetical protein ACFFD2_11085 [Promethearchaeota archaeon]